MIKDDRKMVSMSASRLRRARRLYFRLVCPAIPSGAEGRWMIRELVPRIKARGLYSPNTDARSIEFTFYRKLYEHSHKFPDQSQTIRRNKGWFEWLMANGYGSHPWYEDNIPKIKQRKVANIA